MLKKLFNLFDSNDKQIKRLSIIVDQINKLEEKYKDLSFDELRANLDVYRDHLRPLVAKLDPEFIDSIKAPDKPLKNEIEKEIQQYLLDIRPNVFAIIRETARRKFNRRHYDVQLLGGLALSEGKISELKTGEGKTQVAWLALGLFGLTGRGAHLVTVNDYLARSHGEYSAHIFAELGYSVGITEPNNSYVFIKDEDLKEVKGEEYITKRNELTIQNPGDVNGTNLKVVEKKEAYSCDILYATNNEIGFDYLRDNMVPTLDDIVQRELYFAIVDEIDSILIDEARTPLIISSPANQSNELYIKFADIISGIDTKFVMIDEKRHSVNLTNEGVDLVESKLGVKNLWEDYFYAHHLDNALKAKFLYKDNDEYILQNGEILIVDEFTGRVLPGRRFGEGLHQAIEAKEKVKIKQESKTLATTTFQNLFRIYKYLSGMSGTALTESEEFYKIYKLEVISIPTNKPVVRIDENDIIYKDQEAKFRAVTKEIIEYHRTGQPILVGTTSVSKSEYLSSLLKKNGVKHEVLNAKNHELEAHIISNAGRMNAVTIATNMAGRGTDIRLGEGVNDLGGLYVIGTERHEARRIDNQLRGRAGRQGDNGRSKFFLSLDDEIMRIQGGMIVQSIMSMTHMDPDLPIEASIIGRTIESAQRKVEGSNFDLRKTIVEYDDVINKQREVFYSRRRKIIRLGTNSQLNNNEEVDEKTKFARDNLIGEFIRYFERYLNRNIGDSIDENNKILNLIIPDEVIENRKLTKFDFNNYKSNEYVDKLLEYFKDIIDKQIDELGIRFLFNSYNMLLQSIDLLWMEHMESLQDLKSGIFLNAYAQKDPLVEYKNSGYDLFQIFANTVESQIVSRLFKFTTIEFSEIEIDNIMTNLDEITKTIEEGELGTVPEEFNQKESSNNSATVNNSNIQKVGRNDPCPCGSGKKYKNCHGKIK